MTGSDSTVPPADALLAATTRTRAFLGRIARGFSLTRITDQITVTTSQPRGWTPDRRSTTSGVRRTRTRPPTPLVGRPSASDEGGGSSTATVHDPTREEDEV